MKQTKIKNKYLALLIKSIDLLFLLLVLSLLINDLMSILISFITTINNNSNAQDIIYNMASTSNVNTTISHPTDVRIIHDDGS
jgi:hypothetical protein